jgi:hypothetical protein
VSLNILMKACPDGKFPLQWALAVGIQLVRIFCQLYKLPVTCSPSCTDTNFFISTELRKSFRAVARPSRNCNIFVGADTTAANLQMFACRQHQ